jgi:acyl-CoA dehydrogenase
MDFAPHLPTSRRCARVDRARPRAHLPLEADRASYDEHDNIAPGVLRRVRGEVKAADCGRRSCRARMAGLGCRCRPRRVLRGDERVDLRAGVLQLRGARRRQHDVLAKVATPAQKRDWLAPIVDGGALRRSHDRAAPGGGSDPSMIRTDAERDGGRWVSTATSGSSPAPRRAHFILIARTGDDPRKGLTAFLFDRDQPGWRIVRRIPIMGPEEHGGHCELEFDGLAIPTTRG